MLQQDYTSTPRQTYLNDDQVNTVMNMTAVVIFHWIVFAIVAQTVCVFGIISNCINIFCFVKQGFKDSINISLTGLAISDLGCLLPLVWTNICYTPAFSDLNLPFDTNEIQYMTGGATHVALTRVSSWITATITLERCLCVAMPLKVKEIATPKRTFIIITSIFVVLIAGTSPQYYYYRTGKKYYPARNKTLIGLIYSQELLDFEAISFPINFVFVQFLAFVVIIVCTTILVIELNIKSKWREKSAASGNGNTAKLSSSNKKVAKMVVMISGLFIASFTIIIINCIAINVVPGFTINGKLRHLLTVIGGLGFLFEAMNASMNIFIYYHMSGNYRKVLDEILFQKRCQARDNVTSYMSKK